MASGIRARSIAGNLVSTRIFIFAWLLNAATGVSAQDLADLSLEELANIQITSVSRRSESLLEAPAAAYVITREDIRRSGVTSLAEALRLAPGIEVARNNAHTWSITMRGFNSDLANKLLVLIDGRSVYSPLYAGVFWDAQDVILEDVERIEVIAGPGGTLWGANAVNGVINIITRSAADTQDGYVEAGGGNEEEGFGSLRYGTALGNNASARAYIKYFNRDASRLAADEDADAVDHWDVLRGGFRVDWKPAPDDELMLQGNAYAGQEAGVFQGDFTIGTLPGPGFEDDTEISGANVMGRWNRTLNAESDVSLQLYYDYTRRNIPNIYGETRNTLDIDFQHHFALDGRNDIVWGAGFRNSRDELNNSMFASFVPDNRSDDTWSFFVQDKIDLWQQRLFLTLGSKFEHNDYTGFEYQPNARLSWLATDRQTLWAAVSRAVRIPSRLDADLRLVVPLDIGVPVYVTADGTHDFDSEELIAYEAGYRFQLSDNLTFDLAAFYNDYDKLQTQEAQQPELIIEPPLVYFVLANPLANNLYGETYGSTLSANWQLASNWRVKFDYTWFDMQMHKYAVSQDPDAENIEGNSPENRFGLQSFLDLPHDLSLYTGLRFVDNLPGMDVHSYVAVDVSLLWKAAEHMELSLTAQNLGNKHHLEFGAGNIIENSFYGRISWRF